MRIYMMILFFLLGLTGLDAEEPRKVAQVDACSLLSSNRVEELMGEKAVQAKQIGAEKPQAGALDAAISNCTWQSVTRAGETPRELLSLWVRRAPAAVNDSGQVMESFRINPETKAAREVQGITGFGDLAFWISEKVGGATRVEVDAMKKDVVVRVIMGGVEDPITAQGQARDIIERVWEKLAVK